MLEYVNGLLSGMIIPVVLMLSGIFYAVKLHAFPLLRPRAVLSGLKSEGQRNGVSSARAVTLALAGTLGVGNIVGVSSAIHLGGFGAVFWMWVSALVAMLLKYAEITLAMRHRRRDENGRLCGSAMYYILDLFSSLRNGKLGKAVAGIFAAFFLLNAMTMGSMLQTSAVSEALSGVVGIPPLVTGAVLTLGTLLAIRKGTDGMAALTNCLVPVMSVGYAVMSLAVIFHGRAGLTDAFAQIFSSAFCADAAASGVGGFIFSKAVRYGVMRGLISNEAGCGTAPTAHAIADCSRPAKQGMWGIFEVFVDTIALCTMTALVVILEYSEAARFGGSYMMMTAAAFSSVLGSYASYFLSAAVACFGFATVVCWAHYGLTCARYFSKARWASVSFTAIYCACVFAGAFVRAELAWQLADLAMGAMTAINLFVLVLMWREVREETDDYFYSLPSHKLFKF